MRQAVGYSYDTAGRRVEKGAREAAVAAAAEKAAADSTHQAELAAKAEAARIAAEEPGPRASDRDAIHQSLSALHARNQLSLAAAAARAAETQSRFLANQGDIALAMDDLSKGLERVDTGFQDRLDEYEELRGQRTEVARSLNLQLRKRSKYGAHSGVGGSSEETVDSILDALQAWFHTRSSRAQSDEPLLRAREADASQDAANADAIGGAEGAMASIFAAVKISPALQSQLVSKMRAVTNQTLSTENDTLAQLGSKLTQARQALFEATAQKIMLEEALDRQSIEQRTLAKRVAEWEGGVGAGAVRKGLLAGSGGAAGGAAAAAAAAASASRASLQVVELESQLKKKQKLIAEMERKRTKVAAQLTSLSKALQDRDATVEALTAQLAATQGELSMLHRMEGMSPEAAAAAAGIQAVQAAHHDRDLLAKQLLMRSGQQAEELALLKRFLTNLVWEREESNYAAYTHARDQQLRRIWGAFQRLVEPANLLAAVAAGTVATTAAGAAAAAQLFSAVGLSLPTPAEAAALQPLAEPVASAEAMVRVLVASPSFARSSDADFAAVIAAINAGAGASNAEVARWAQNMIDEDRAASATATAGTAAAAASTHPSGPPSPIKRHRSLLAPQTAAVAVTAHLSFAKFLSCVLRLHPAERRAEQQRLWRCVWHVFQGLDHDRDGVLSPAELEAGFRKESIGITREMLDNVVLCCTRPLPDASIKPAKISLAQATELQSTVDTGADAIASASVPLDFLQFASLFSVPQLRSIFDAPPLRHATNPAVKRRAAVVARVALETASSSAVATPKSPGKALLQRAKTASGTGAPPFSPAFARAESESSSAAAPDDAAPYFCHGTKDLLLAMLSYDPDDTAAAAALAAPGEKLQARWMDGAVGAAAGTAGAAAKGSSASMMEKALEALCAPRLLSFPQLMDALAAAAPGASSGSGGLLSARGSMAAASKRRSVAATHTPPASDFDAASGDHWVDGSPSSSGPPSHSNSRRHSKQPQQSGGLASSRHSIAQQLEAPIARGAASERRRSGAPGGSATVSLSARRSKHAAASAAPTPVAPRSPPLTAVAASASSPTTQQPEARPPVPTLVLSLTRPSSATSRPVIGSKPDTPRNATSPLDPGAATATAASAVATAAAAAIPPAASAASVPSRTARNNRRSSLLLRLADTDPDAPPLSPEDLLSMQNTGRDVDLSSRDALAAAIAGVAAKLSSKPDSRRAETESVLVAAASADDVTTMDTQRHDQSDPTTTEPQAGEGATEHASVSPPPAIEDAADTAAATAVDAASHSTLEPAPPQTPKEGAQARPSRPGSSRGAAQSLSRPMSAVGVTASSAASSRAVSRQSSVLARESAPPPAPTDPAAASRAAHDAYEAAMERMLAEEEAEAEAAAAAALAESNAGAQEFEDDAEDEEATMVAAASIRPAPRLQLSMHRQATAEEKEQQLHSFSSPPSSRPLSKHDHRMQTIHQTVHMHAAGLTNESAEADGHAATQHDRGGMHLRAPVATLLRDLEYKESEARTFRQLYETEHARVQQLERMLKLTTAHASSSSGGQSARGSSTTSAAATSLPPRGALTAREAGVRAWEPRPISASMLSPRAPPVSVTHRAVHRDSSAAPSSAAATSSFQYDGLISRRKDAVQAALLSPHTFAKSSSTAPYPRALQRPVLAFSR